MQTILVVEDEVAIAEFIQDVLEADGYHVRLARHGQEALDQLDQLRPQLILSDIMMPIMDGLQFCRAVLTQAAYRTIPIILMSAGTPPAAVADQPYASFLAKPFALTELEAVIARVLMDGRSC